jgi:hypothetical protein
MESSSFVSRFSFIDVLIGPNNLDLISIGLHVNIPSP